MATGPDRDNFKNWELGSIWECPVDATIVHRDRLLSRLIQTDRPFREWVTLEDGPEVMANFGAGKVSLRFGKHSHRREVREWLRSTQRPFLCRLELSAQGGGGLAGALAMMRSALPGKLDEVPTILGEEEVLDGVSIDQLVKQNGIPDGDGVILVAETALRLRTDDDVPLDQVKLHLHNGGVLTCDIQGVGRQKYLRVRAFDAGSRGRRTLRNVRLIASPAPRFVSSLDEVRGSALDDLITVSNDHLRAWMDYENADRRRKEEILEKRKGKPLEYLEVVEGPLAARGTRASYRVALANPEDALDHWVSAGGDRNAKTWKVDAAVSIHDLAKPTNKEVQGGLTEIQRDKSGRILALVTLERSVPPPSKAKLVAAPHWGDKAQHDRRDEAIERLRRGSAANPDLLRYLLFPATIPSIESKDRTFRARPGGKVLNDQQRRAVIRAAREPSVLLIQGPPGTGKTTVIAEIIHQLRRRWRNVELDDEERGPLRVLVASIQNDAVDNAGEKLSKEEVFVDLHVSQEKDAVAHSSATDLRSRAIAAKLYSQLQTNPGFLRYVRLCKVSDLVRSLTPHFAVPDKSTQRHIDEVLNIPDVGQELTESMRSELLRLNRELQRLLLEFEKRAEENESETGPTVEVDADFLSLVHAIVEETAPLSEENLKHRLQLIIGLQKLLEHIEASPDADLESLRIAAMGSGSIRRADERQRLDERATNAWLEIRRRSEALLHGRGREDQDPLTSVFEQWKREANDWIGRVNGHLQALFDDHAQSEPAIIFDWIRSLTARPQTMPDVIRSYAPVTATTCQKSSKFDRIPYNVVIIDEAARGGLDLLIPMTMGHSVILIGDQNQLPPHVESELERELEEDLRREVDLSTTSLFSYLWNELGGTTSSNCVALDTQFRMHRDIGTLVSRTFYEPEVTLKHGCEGGVDAERAPDFGLCDDEPFVWVDTSDQLQKGNFAGWPFQEENPWEAELVISLLSRLSDAAIAELKSRGETRRPIGVIPFYSKQRDLLEREIRKRLPRFADLVELGTADSFQGKEFPLVILSTVRSNPEGRVGFLALPNRLNVGLSRAQSQVILLGDSDCLTHSERGSEPFKSLWNDVNDPTLPGRVIRSLDL